MQSEKLDITTTTTKSPKKQSGGCKDCGGRLNTNQVEQIKELQKVGYDNNQIASLLRVYKQDVDKVK